LSIQPAGGERGPTRARAGDTVRFAVQLVPRSAGSSRQAAGQAGSNLPPAPIHIEVRSPAGKVVGYYGASLALVNGAGEFTIPLALNDLPGAWRVTAREPYSHQTASAVFVVNR
jgi:uncharacterized protein YfaS (alpha-2-macroglobulin family)